MRRIPVTLALALGLPLLASGALAQSGTLIPLPLGGDATAPLSAADFDRLNGDRVDAERHRGTFISDEVAPPVILSPLRPIEARGRPAGSAIRFDGERRTLQFALFVPDPQTVNALRVATLSSIYVLPERSRYRVYVNDTFIGESRLENFDEPGAVDFPLGPATLLPGQNNVRIELIQYHRIYCGPEASFALWSDIDLAASGAILSTQEGVSGTDGFLMGLAAAAATGSGVEIRGAGMLGDYRDQWVNQITQRISAALGGDPIPFRFTDYWGVQGAARSASRITFLPSTANRLSFRTAGDGAQVMVVEFVPGEPPHALPEFETMLPRVAERAQPTLIATQVPVPFSDFGFRTTEIYDRYARLDQRFRLPDDYIVLTNAKAEIRLDYIYVPDLAEGAMLLVNINDTNVRLLPLRGEAGQLIEQFPVRFEARLLRAGINTLSFEVMVPGDPPDMPCATADTPVLAIGESSNLMVPYSPSMFLPDMHVAFSGLTPDSVVVNELTERSFDANDIVTLRAALSGGERADAAALNARLHLLTLDDLGSVPAGGYRVSRRAIEAALFTEPEPAALADAGGDEGHALLRIQERGDSRAVLTRGWEWLTSGFTTSLQWLQPRSGLLLENWLAEQNAQAVLLQLDPARPTQIWMLRAPDSDISAIASAMVAARTTAEGPRGQVAILDRDGRWQSWVAPDRQPVLLEPVTLGNVRHVVGNFVSAMPIRYVLGLFFLALVSALFALRLVIATREHRS